MPNLNMMDWAKRIDPDGTTAVVANLLSQTNEFMVDLGLVQGNLPTGHRSTITTGLPLIYYRSLNQGIPTSKATTVQVDESCSILEARSEIDIDLAMLNGQTAEFRLSEAQHFLEALSQKATSGYFYGNPASDPKEILGLSARYSDTTAGNGQNILKSDGAGNVNTSVWLIGMSDRTVFGIFPKGSKAGILQEDLGRYTAQNVGGVAGNMMEVLGERFQLKLGLCVKDWRYAVRICNIDTAKFDLLTGEMAPTHLKNLIHQMARALARIPSRGSVKLGFYMNPSVFSVLMRVALEKSAAALSVQSALDQFGRPSMMLSFLGVPIRQVDALLNTEATVA